jgi:hypothetical protein
VMAGYRNLPKRGILFKTDFATMIDVRSVKTA